MITLQDGGPNSTVFFGEATLHFAKPKDAKTWEDYQEAARKLLAELRKDYNAMGIPMLIGAMIETLDNEYAAKNSG